MKRLWNVAKRLARAAGIRRPRNPIPSDALGTPWFERVRWAQAEVGRLDPHPQYLGAYQSEEALYWLRAAEWLWEDAQAEKGGRTLDIGCAYGTLATFAKKEFGGEVCCMDALDVYISPKLLKEHDLKFGRGSIEYDPIPFEGRFDRIIFTEVLEHLNFHPVPTLERIRDALVPGGKLYLTTPDADAWGRVTEYYKRFDDMPPPRPDADRSKWIDAHIYQFDERELRTVFRRAGLSVLREARSPGVFRKHLNYVLTRR